MNKELTWAVVPTGVGAAQQEVEARGSTQRRQRRLEKLGTRLREDSGVVRWIEVGLASRE
jgi:hypothetical protein